MTKPKHASAIYCPSCSSLEVVEGNLDVSRFYPKRSLFRALLGKPLPLASSQAHACLNCGLLWRHIDPQQLRDNASRHGLSAHRTSVMNAVAIAPGKRHTHT